jgi:hypothetical protein
MEPIRGKTKHGELSLDEIANLMPGMSELMVAMGQRFQTMYHAARDGNWLLAAYQLRTIRKLFNTSKLTRPKYAKAVDEFVEARMRPIEAAIQAKSWPQFLEAARGAIRASDQYHKDWGYEYIRYRVSEESTQAYRLAAADDAATG